MAILVAVDCCFVSGVGVSRKNKYYAGKYYWLKSSVCLHWKINTLKEGMSPDWMMPFFILSKGALSLTSPSIKYNTCVERIRHYVMRTFVIPSISKPEFFIRRNCMARLSTEHRWLDTNLPLTVDGTSDHFRASGRWRHAVHSARVDTNAKIGNAHDAAWSVRWLLCPEWQR